jgi:hypothetical protein
MKITGFFDNVQARSSHLSWFSVETGLKTVLYLFSFGLSIGFAVGKPACFLVMLEYFGAPSLRTHPRTLRTHAIAHTHTQSHTHT